MHHRTVTIAFLLWLVGAPLPAQVPDSAFVTVYRGGSRVFITPPGGVPWAEYAARYLPQFDPLHPDTAMLRAGYDELFGGSILDFTAPVPATLAAGYYYVFGDSGTARVEPSGLMGSVVIRTGPPDWPRVEPEYDGRIAGTPSGSGSGPPGVALHWGQPLVFESLPAVVGGTRNRPTIMVARAAEAVLVAFDTARGALHSPGWRGGVEPIPTLARVFHVRGTGQWFLLVRWDGEYCRGDYGLYDVTTIVPRFVLETPGACEE